MANRVYLVMDKEFLGKHLEKIKNEFVFYCLVRPGNLFWSYENKDEMYAEHMRTIGNFDSPVFIEGHTNFQYQGKGNVYVEKVYEKKKGSLYDPLEPLPKNELREVNLEELIKEDDKKVESMVSNLIPNIFGN